MGRPPKKLMQQEENKILKPIDNEKSISCCSTHLKIGSWSKVARHDQAIVIKIYFKKDLMAWDILGDNGVKNRIETKFNNIDAFKISDMDSSEESTFQVQLKATPEIKIDDAKEARRHPKWKNWEDFTNGQASSTRLHTFTCHKLKLTKFYEKILAAKSVLTNLFNHPILLDEDPNLSQPLSGYPTNQNLDQSVPVQFPNGQVSNNFVGMETDPNPSQAPSGYPLNQLPASSSNFTTLRAHTQPNWRVVQAAFPNQHVFVGPKQSPANYPQIPALQIQPRCRIPPLDDKQEEYVSIGGDRLALLLRTLERDVCGEYQKLDGLPGFSELEKLIKFGDNPIYEIDYGGFEKVYDYDGMPPPPCQNGSDIS